MDFQPWPKIARLNRDITITEKIDGTNAAILISEEVAPALLPKGVITEVLDEYFGEGVDALVQAQSRKRIITPESDNFGFAAWVREHAEELVDLLGPGRHFGEWWGSGIQRGYGLTKGAKRFSLFNTDRYTDTVVFDDGTVIAPVPVLYRGPFNQLEINRALSRLHVASSVAAPGFMKPEGIIVFHHAAQTMFKVTLEGDDAPKGLQS